MLGRSLSIGAREQRERLLFIALVGPNLLLFGIFTFWPLIYNVYLSFVRWDMISPVKVWVGFDNYQMMLADPKFGTILFNTFYFTVVAVLVLLVLGLGAALLLNQPLRGRNGVRAVLFAPTVLSGAAIGIVWVYVFDPRYGLIDAILGWFGANSPNWLTDPRWAMPTVIIVYVWKNLGYAVVIFLAGLQAIPRELYDAARVDGASTWQRFRFVTLPGLSPVMFFLVLTSILSSFQAFDIIKTMTDGGPVDATTVLPIYTYKLTFSFFRFGDGAAAATMLLVGLVGVAFLYLWAARREEAA